MRNDEDEDEDEDNEDWNSATTYGSKEVNSYMRRTHTSIDGLTV